jgi:DNA-binding IclR family transcriptional regulator
MTRNAVGGTAGGAAAVTRAIAVLTALASRGALTGAALAKLLGLQKSSIADVCASLMAEGMVLRRRDAMYILGPRLEQLGASLGRSSRLFELFDRAVLQESALEGMTVTLDVLQGAETVCLAARLGRVPLPSTPRPGMRTPDLTAAAGSAILATAPRDELRQMLERFASHQSVPAEQIDGLLTEPRSPQQPARHLAEAPTGAWHLAVGVPSTAERPLFCAVVVHLPAGDPAGSVRALTDAVVRCARSIGEEARQETLPDPV